MGGRLVGCPLGLDRRVGGGVVGGLAHGGVSALADGRVRGVVAVGSSGLGRVLDVVGLDGQSWVTPEEGGGTEDHEDTLSDDEGDLVGDGLSAVSLLELVDTEGATGEDDGDGEADAGNEGLQAPVDLGEAVGHEEADEEVGKGGHEADEDDELQAQTSLTDLVTNLTSVNGGGSDRKGTTSTLEDEAEDIGRKEDPHPD